MARPPSAPDPVRIHFAEFELDEANARLLRNGEAVALAPTPFNLLCALARRPGDLLTKEMLLDAVWGHQFVSESVLKTAIGKLRLVLGDDTQEPRFIETVSRRGYRFIARAADPSMAPQQAVETAARESPPFVGRTEAVGRLRRGWKRAAGGQRAIVWVAGEPGIGKTTVIEHFVSSLGPGVACARGQCVEHYGAAEPYLPVLEAVAELCRSDASLPTLMRSVAPTWLLQLPWLNTAEEREALRRELAGVGPDRMLREMGELLDRYTEQRPLLLVTEDLHWSDRATIQLIDHVARRRGRSCLMWLTSFRVAEVVALEHPLNPLRRELRLHRLCDEVLLDPFSETEVADCVARSSPRLSQDESFVRALHERTDGVPLFVTSVIAEVMERSSDDEDAEALLAAVAVPDNVAAIIDHYIDQLESGQRSLLAAAAVCGVQFRAETVALALEREVAEVAMACDELARVHVWLSASYAADADDAMGHSYGFRHALFRQVLYERTPPPTRMQLHRDVGAALAQERAAGASVAASELAMHFDRGRQPLAALRYYVEGAQAALQNFSPATCMGLTERALALVRHAPQGPERDALEMAASTLRALAAFQLLGVGAEAMTAFERAYALLEGAPGHPVRGRLLHGYGYVLSLRGEYARALELAQRAEALSRESDDLLLMLVACLLHGHVHHIQGQTQVSRSWNERGLAIAASIELGSNEVFAMDPQATLHCMLAIDLVRCGLVAQGRMHLLEARARAKQSRQPITRLGVAWHEALFEVRLDNAERVDALANELRALVDEFSLGQGKSASKWFRGWADARQGRPQEGYRLIREAYEHNTELGMRAGASEVLAYAAQALLLAGDTAGASVQLQQALRLAGELSERVFLPQLFLLEAAIARAEGRPAAGTVCARRAIEEARAQEAPWFALLALADLCEHHDAGVDDCKALQELVDGLPEAAGTALVSRARSILLAAKRA